MEFWQYFRVDEQLDASGGCWFSGYPSISLEGQHHLMDGWWGDGEEALNVSFSGWAPDDKRISVNEGQVLALFVGEAGFLDRGVHVT